MKAVVWKGPEQVSVEEVPVPEIVEPYDALVRVTLSAICGSDLHVYHQMIPGIEEGVILGHEFVGIVEEVGSRTNVIRPGDRVVSSFFSCCATCWYCKKGWYSQCENRMIFGMGEFYGDLPGAQAEKVRVPNADATLVKVPENLSDEQAIFVGDIMATGMFAAERGEINVGDTVAVVGCGPVGIMATMCASLFGPARIIAVDMVEERLELAKRLGAIPVDSNKQHPAQTVLELTGGRGADVVLECVGNHKAVELAIDCVRPAGTISAVGVNDVIEYPFPIAAAWLKDLSFRTGICNVPKYMTQLLTLIKAGKLDPTIIISHRMQLEQAEEAYRMFANRQATKIVLYP